MKILLAHRRQLGKIPDAQNLSKQVQGNRNAVGNMYLAMTICLLGEYSPKVSDG